MLDGLPKVAIEHGLPALAEQLRASIKKHGEPKPTAVTFRRMTEAAKQRHWRQHLRSEPRDRTLVSTADRVTLKVRRDLDGG